MPIYTELRPGATERSTANLSDRRNSFARQAALDAFGPKAVHHLNGSGFVDRKPGDGLEDADEIVEGRQAIARWLVLAMDSEGEDAEVAYQTANELRQVLDLDWTEIIGREAA
jgi:hypothetical protein